MKCTYVFLVTASQASDSLKVPCARSSSMQGQDLGNDNSRESRLGDWVCMQTLIPKISYKDKLQTSERTSLLLLNKSHYQGFDI